MTEEPKPRKIKHRAHKCFGLHSRIITQALVDALKAGWDPDLTSLRKRKVGDKQLDSRAYKVGHTKTSRTRAEIRNAESRKPVR